MAWRIHLTNISRSISTEIGETILDAALLAGVDYPFGCMEGQCGACKTRLISGIIDPGESSGLGLSEADAAEGYFLACQAHAKSDLEIDFLIRTN
jgi:ferredoxin